MIELQPGFWGHPNTNPIQCWYPCWNFTCGIYESMYLPVLCHMNACLRQKKTKRKSNASPLLTKRPSKIPTTTTTTTASTIGWEYSPKISHRAWKGQFPIGISFLQWAIFRFHVSFRGRLAIDYRCFFPGLEDNDFEEQRSLPLRLWCGSDFDWISSSLANQSEYIFFEALGSLGYRSRWDDRLMDGWWDVFSHLKDGVYLRWNGLDGLEVSNDGHIRSIGKWRKTGRFFENNLKRYYCYLFGAEFYA